MAERTGDAFRARLDAGVVLLDGGLGTLLIAGGLAQGQAPERWVLEHPERIVGAHRRYALAGCDVIHAVTFGANPPKLAAVGLGGRTAEVNREAVALAREGAGERTLVAGDIGPTGAFLPPMGAATEDGYRRAYDEQVAALVDAGVDLLSIETMYDLREALAATRAAAASGLPVLASMTFEARKRGHFTIMGDRIVPSFRALCEAGATAVGFNCSVESGPMLAMVREAAAAELPAAIVAQPNAGQPRVTGDGVVYDASPEAFVTDLLAMVEAGARIVGGCCGTDPDFIRRARAALGGAA